jgi:GntR family transcriptional regulator of arabinose operon
MLDRTSALSESRWEKIAISIRDGIEMGRLPPGSRLPSEDQLAVEWQVSRMTAHRAMNELDRLGLVLRKRRVGTVVVGPQSVVGPAFASTPRKREAGRRIALLLFHVNDYPQITYVHGFQSRMVEADRLLLFDTRNQSERECQCLQQASEDADAICIYPTGAPEATALLREIARNKPVLCLDRIPAGLDTVDAVVTDNYRSTDSALRFLADSGKHRQIAFFTTDNLAVSSVRERHEAFVHFLRERELSEDEISSLIRTFPRGAGYDFDRFSENVHDALFAMLHRRNPPTAIFCLEDYFLWAVMEACDRIGVQVPDDMDIVSFSDCPQMVPRLTRSVHRIVQGAYEMGRNALERIQRRLDGELLDPEIFRVAASFAAPSALRQPLSHRRI